jgi:hypothetical protein
MDDQILTGVGEKDTRPVVAAVSQISIDEEETFKHISELLSQQPQRGGRGSGRRPVLRFFRGYGSALLMGLPVLPIAVSAITIGIYLSNPSFAGWVSVLWGAGVTYIAWLLISLPFIALTSPKNANSRSYGLLDSRLEQLETRLGVIRNNTPREEDLPEYQRVALNEAFDKLEDISKDLYESDMRLPWVMGYGYVNTWGKLHRAEEALVEVEPVEMTMRGAMHDKMAIAGSQITNREELLAKLRYAVKKLDPSMANLFRPYAAPAAPTETESPDIQQLQQDVQQIAQHLHLKLGGDRTSEQKMRVPQDTEDPARARLTLREVRRALNDYRDHLWEGLVRARNNLLGVTFVTGLGTHILLCIAILALTPVNGSTDAAHAAIISAATYYMLGAIAGLFGRISQASIANIAVDDYGLTLAQIISRPLYSGLAGIGGVLVSSTLLSIDNRNGMNIQSIFALNQPDLLIVAAAFGLTPNLIASGLQNQTNKYLSALRSSKTTTSDTNANNGDGQSAGE